MSVVSLVRQFLDGEIDVSAGSLHYRVYAWWISKDMRKRRVTRENLCHYMRVLLIWAPLEWFFKQSLLWFIRPWMAAIVLAFTLGVGLGLSSSSSETIGVLLAGFLLALLTGSFTGHVYLYESKGGRATLTCLGIEHAMLILFGFATSGLTLVSLAYLIGFLTGLVILVGLLVLVGILLLGEFMWNQARERRKGRRESGFVRETKQEPMLHVVGAYVMAQKRKICPYIRFPEEMPI